MHATPIALSPTRFYRQVHDIVLDRSMRAMIISGMLYYAGSDLMIAL